MLPLLLWLHFSVLFFDPRAPEDRAPRNAIGRRVYVTGRL